MSLCNIQLLSSSLEQLQGFTSNFVWMFIGWIPTKFVKNGVLPYFSWNYWKSYAIFGQFLENLL